MIIEKKVNVLLLTHYQGIPNEDYEKIINFCRIRNVYVIEDMSQSYKSSINGIEIGTKGDVVLYSYAFDKPFTSMFCGSLKFNTCKKSLKIYLILFRRKY